MATNAAVAAHFLTTTLSGATATDHFGYYVDGTR